MKQLVGISILRILFGWSILAGGTLAMAQDLEQHRWDYRLLLIYVDKLESENYRNQMSILKKEMVGLEERKLLVYTFWKDKYQVGFEDTEWKMADKEFAGATIPDSGFEVILRGLDGGDKLRQDSVIDTETLFARIDSMPMRRQEMKNK
jgi:hypothetical protein